jgi:hypothetical protein
MFGNKVLPLREQDMRDAVAAPLNAGVPGIGASLNCRYRNPAHEHRVRETLEEEQARRAVNSGCPPVHHGRARGAVRASPHTRRNRRALDLLAALCGGAGDVGRRQTGPRKLSPIRLQADATQRRFRSINAVTQTGRIL